jgi:hypothetical protein
MKSKAEKTVTAWRRAQNLRREPVRLYRCSGGPFGGQQIALSGGSSPVSTLVFRVGDQVGYYAGSGATVIWKEDRP